MMMISSAGNCFLDYNNRVSSANSIKEQMPKMMAALTAATDPEEIKRYKNAVDSCLELGPKIEAQARAIAKEIGIADEDFGKIFSADEFEAYTHRGKKLNNLSELLGNLVSVKS
jgi:purine-nucleoside phosphorylase